MIMTIGFHYFIIGRINLNWYQSISIWSAYLRFNKIFNNLTEFNLFFFTIACVVTRETKICKQLEYLMRTETNTYLAIALAYWTLE